MLLVFISTLFGSDNERLMAPAFVVFYLLIAHIIQDYFYPHKNILFILIACAFLASFHRTIGRYPLPGINIMIILSLSSLLIVTIASYIFKTTVIERAQKLNNV
jgi:predicted PurR-regulated permease PerM